MPFQVSPGVNVSEIDLTLVVPNVATSIGAMAGSFQWGPVLERTSITTENKLVNTFGKPNDDTQEYFHTAANYLAYSNNLLVVRNTGSDAKNAQVGDDDNGMLSGSISAISLDAMGGGAGELITYDVLTGKFTGYGQKDDGTGSE